MNTRTCLNPECGTKFIVPTKSPSQKYCDKSCFNAHVKAQQLERREFKVCQNEGCGKTLTAKDLKKFCSSSCAAVFNNKNAPKRRKKTFEQRVIECSSIFFDIPLSDVTEEHKEQYLEKAIKLRTQGKLSIRAILKELKSPYSMEGPLNIYFSEHGIDKTITTDKMEIAQEIAKTRLEEMRKIPRKIKERAKKEVYPHSKLTLNTCQVKGCDKKYVSRKPKKFCEHHNTYYAMSRRHVYNFNFHIFSYPDLFDLDMVRKYGFYHSGNIKGKKKNLKGLSRDHKVSVADARKYGYDPYYISHVMNCQLLTHSENVRKGTSSSISYEELVRLVDEFDANRKVVKGIRGAILDTE